MRLLASVLAALLLLPGAGAASKADGFPLNPYARVFGELDGLPNLAVVSLAQDASGDLWIGTQAGLARMRGGRIEAIPGPPGVPYPFVNALLPTPEGLLMGTYGDGLFRFDGQRWRQWSTAGDQRILQIENLVPDGEGGALVVRGSQRVLRIRGDALTVAEDMPETFVAALARTPKGWVAATDQGVLAKLGGRWTPLGKMNWPAQSLAFFQGRLWAATQRGVFAWEGGQWRITGDFGDLSFTRLAIGPGLEDSQALWAASNRGIFRFERDRWEPIRSTVGAVEPFTTCFLFTGGGRDAHQFWAGSFSGLLRWQGGGWNVMPQDTPITGRIAFSLLPLPDGTLWFGDSGGKMCRYQDGTWTTYTSVEGRQTALVLRMAHVPEAPGGPMVLAAFRDQGLAAFQGGRWRWLNLQGMAPTALGYVHGFLLGRHRGKPGVWLASREGMGFWDLGAKVETLSGAGLPGPPNVHCMIEDPRDPGALWVGGLSGQLWRLKGERWETPVPWLKAPFINELIWIRRPEGLHLLVATSAAGLFELDPRDLSKPFRHWEVDRIPGFGGPIQMDVMAEPSGRVWLFTDRGVYRLGPGGEVEANYTREDGLPANLTTIRSAAIDARGRLWTSTARGPSFLDLGRLRDTPRGELRWTDIKGSLGPFAPGASLSHRARRLTFAFDLPTMHREGDVRYRTQLEGMEPAPGPWSSERQAVFPILSSGRYRLLVWAQDPYGRESGPLSFEFQVLPPLWKHPLAYLAYGLLLAALGWGLYRWRTRHLQRRNAELEVAVSTATQELRDVNDRLYHLNDAKNRIIAVAAHDLRNPLNGIELECEYLEPDAREDQIPSLEHIRGEAGSMLHLIQSLLDVNAIESGHVERPVLQAVDPVRVGRDILKVYAPRASKKGITLLDELGPEGNLIQADPDHLHRILDNLVSNAIKFSPVGRRVWLIREDTAEGMKLLVRDEGQGLTEADKARLFSPYARLSARPTAGESSVGLGLSIVRDLTVGMGGRIWAEGAPGQGATFQVLLPRPLTHEI